MIQISFYGAFHSFCIVDLQLYTKPILVQTIERKEKNREEIMKNKYKWMYRSHGIAFYITTFAVVILSVKKMVYVCLSVYVKTAQSDLMRIGTYLLRWLIIKICTHKMISHKNIMLE